MPTEFTKNMDKFRISTSDDGSVTKYPRERLMSESGAFDDPFPHEQKEKFFGETSDADHEENELNFRRRSNLMDRFTEDRSARGIIERKDNRDLAFELFNNSLLAKGKPEITREEFDSGFTKRDTQEGLQFVTKGKIRPPKPTVTDRIRTVEAKKGFSGIVKKETKFIVGEQGAEFVEVIPLQNKNRPIMDLGFNMGFRMGKNTKKNSIVDFDMFNPTGKKKNRQGTRNSKSDFDFFKVF
jgi:hypothetical protein